MCVCVCVCVCTRAPMCVRERARAYVYVFMCVCACARVCACVCAHVFVVYECCGNKTQIRAQWSLPEWTALTSKFHAIFLRTLFWATYNPRTQKAVWRSQYGDCVWGGRSGVRMRAGAGIFSFSKPSTSTVWDNHTRVQFPAVFLPSGKAVGEWSWPLISK